MIAENSLKVMQDFFTDVLNTHELSHLEGYLSPDFLNHTPMPGTRNDAQGYKHGLTVLFIAFYNLRYEIESYSADGGEVEVRWTATASHPGGLIGRHGVIIPTGKQMCWQGVTRARIRDGRIDELWTHQDETRLLAQLSEMPLVLVEN
jgi:predicted ester cyclase